VHRLKSEDFYLLERYTLIFRKKRGKKIPVSGHSHAKKLCTYIAQARAPFGHNSSFSAALAALPTYNIAEMSPINSLHTTVWVTN